MVGRTSKRLEAAMLIALMAAGSVLLWIGVPVGWLWLASQLVETQQPQFGPYLLVLAGIAVSVLAISIALVRLDRRFAHLVGAADGPRVPLPWLRSLRGERGSGRRTTVLDVVMVTSVVGALVILAIWFFFFAHYTVIA
jgi:hypothetical protein